LVGSVQPQVSLIRPAFGPNVLKGTRERRFTFEQG
jgi:hypothetical protein